MKHSIPRRRVITSNKSKYDRNHLTKILPTTSNSVRKINNKFDIDLFLYS